MITQISHIAFHTNDLEASLDFYCNKLGLEEAFRIYGDDGALWIVYIKSGRESFIELFPSAKTEPTTGSYSHCCLAVDDMTKTLEELRARGMNLPGEAKFGKDGNCQYWITDPDGNRIELMQIMPDSAQAKAYR